MDEGRFREDLFYRLSVVPIKIPPLRDYREDIPALASYFMDQMAQANGRTPRTFSKDALATLQLHTWPGNVRELKNVIERILIMSPDSKSSQILPDMIPSELNDDMNKSDGGFDRTEFAGLQIREAREIFERRYLEAQVSRFGGNISKTAVFIGMERSALHRKLKSLGFHSDGRDRAINN